MMTQLLNLLRKWPLLLVGLALFLWGISLADGEEDKSDARALLLGVASVIIGAGMVVVVGNEVVDRSHSKQVPVEDGTTGGDPAGEGD